MWNDIWRGGSYSIIGGAHIHVFVFCVINFFWNRLFLWSVNTNIWIWAPPPPIIELDVRHCFLHVFLIFLLPSLLANSRILRSMRSWWDEMTTKGRTIWLLRGRLEDFETNFLQSKEKEKKIIQHTIEKKKYHAKESAQRKIPICKSTDVLRFSIVSTGLQDFASLSRHICLKCIWHEISYFLKWKNSLSCSVTCFPVSCFYGLFPRYFNLFDM
jgi:hypothetical protein